jgi:predicted porin
MKNYSLSALVAAGLLASAAGTASAADLGGNCCADLEERIAELEATTVRKGNRKVSLTISGWVGEQVTFWDDKHESNLYVQGLGATLSSHFRLSGSAKISNDVSAGYVMHIEVRSVDPLLLNNQNNDDGGAGLGILESYWYLKSNQLGKLSVGQQSTVTDNLAILTDGSGSLVQANWVLFEGAGFFLRNSSAAGSSQTANIWGDGLTCYTFSNTLGIGGDCTGVPTNSIKYESPTIAGFSVSAAWGEDDFWDAGLRYAGELAGFKLAFAVGYSQRTDNNPFTAGSSFNHQKVDQIQLGGYIQHVATGLFVHGAYEREDVSGVTVGSAAGSLTAVQAARLNDLNPEMWYIKGGIRQKWLPYGHTVAYGEYAEANNKVSTTALAADIIGSNVNWWGLGLVQEIDAAAMSMWVKYRNVDGNFTTAAGAAANATNGWTAGKNGVDNLQMVTFGAMISF